MHEIGLTTRVLDSVTQVAEEQGALAVNKIKLRIGTMSGIVTSALEFAFDELKELSDYELCKSAELDIHELSSLEDCRKFEIVLIEVDLPE
ncbi:MAG: hydrogenase maturation nickel metallochaperone HypA [Eggerthellaceae bacterium]|nr:hydrogenase maturation nickel metallochaperone HypA [Eggerthellaceae bacterium]